MNNSGKVLLERDATINKVETKKRYSVVSLAFNQEEESLFNQSVKARVKVDKK